MNPAFLTAALLASSAVDDFTLRDHRGTAWRLAEQREPVVVIVFLGCDCPLAKLYAPRLAELQRTYGPRGVSFVGINANAHEGISDLARYIQVHKPPFPILKNPGAHVADLLKAERTPEVFVLAKTMGTGTLRSQFLSPLFLLRYRGRIDDQATVDGHRATPTRHDLAQALDELLGGRPVSVPLTPATGCFIARTPPPAKAGAVTYTRDVAPILNRHCVVCHRPGEIAPFSLVSYRDAAGWADTIREVVAAGRMPPWSADPAFGHFANDPSLSADEKRQLDEWVRDGCPEGDPADLPKPPTFPDGWSLGTPDVIVEMATPFVVPATGVVEYQFFEIDPGFTRDTWIRAAEVRPGNRAVVHHCTVFLKPPGETDLVEQGRLGSFCLAAMSLGSPPMQLPPGTAKLVPAGWRMVFVVHYTPIGSPQCDRTSLGLWIADPKQVRREVATKVMVDSNLQIPPQVKHHEVTQTWRINDDLLVYALFPHMHLRGRSFRYEVEYPDGTVETLLSVPAYDFNWQHRYELAEPKRVPKGAQLRCRAIYDNSPANPNNPDPSATVHTGQQSWDEMFNGYWDIALADQDLTQSAGGKSVLWRTVPIVLLLGLTWLGLVLRRRKIATLQSGH